MVIRLKRSSSCERPARATRPLSPRGANMAFLNPVLRLVQIPSWEPLLASHDPLLHPLRSVLSTDHLVLLLSPITHFIQSHFESFSLAVLLLNRFNIIFERFIPHFVLLLGGVGLPKLSHEFLKLSLIKTFSTI